MENKASVADQTRTTLSERAFAGRLAYLQEAAAALDIGPPVVRQRRRPSIYCYFIGGEHGPIKIGVARSPFARLQTLQTSNSDELFLYAYRGGGQAQERDLHREFGKYHLRGEWFERCDAILRRIIYWQELELAETVASIPKPVTIALDHLANCRRV